jgi:CheY-like chemotaxis protein
MHRRIHSLAEIAKLSKLEFTGRTSSALEALLKRLHQNAKSVTPSTLNTIVNALTTLERLCVRGIEQKLAHCPPVKILVVEDEILARRAIVGTLQLAFEKPESANDGAEALNLALQKTYDVIFSDIEMPLLGGFDFCTRIREAGPNRETPVIFITSHIDFESRAQASRSGGSDFIAKPFLPIEITVKALTFALEGRLRRIDAGAVPVSLPPTRADNTDLLPAANA